MGFTYDNNGNMTVLTNPATIDNEFEFNKIGAIKALLMGADPALGSERDAGSPCQ